MIIEADSNHCQIVQRNLAGERTVDEQTFASLTILTEQLERLKKLDNIFSDVAFSSAVERLKGQENAVAVEA